MKLSDYIPSLLAFAAMNRISDRQARPVEEVKPREPGAAPAALRRPLLTGRRGKGTRKQRTEKRK